MAKLLERHSRVLTPDGGHRGCRCEAAAAWTQNGYYLHLGEIVDMLVQETLDAAFADHTKASQRSPLRLAEVR